MIICRRRRRDHAEGARARDVRGAGWKSSKMFICGIIARRDC